MNRAIFLDRDGILNQLILNPKTGEYESPHFPEDLELMPGALDAMRKLSAKGYLLFVISNQPSYAKGKTTLENIKEIHSKLQKQIEDYSIDVRQYYYCYHHPHGIVPEYSGPCACRKPKPFFILQAQKEYDLDLEHSWMIGDQDTDVECGTSAGLQTIMILNEHSSKKRGASIPTLSARDLPETIKLIPNIQ